MSEIEIDPGYVSGHAALEDLEKRVAAIEEVLRALAQEPEDEDPTGILRFVQRARARREAERT